MMPPQIRFFVTGHGRSGTKWLAELLNRSASVRVHHEPHHWGDKFHYMDWFDGKDATPFLEKRKERISSKIATKFHPQGKDYAEVNSYLRYCVPELRKVYDVPVVAVVRDGRLTVRSMLNQGIYQHENYPPIEPTSFPWSKPWPTMDAFQKTCWYWMDTYTRLLRRGVQCFRLDLLDSDYGYFQNLCDAIGIEYIPLDEWAKSAGHPTNQYIELDEPLGWTLEQSEAFDAIAGDMQERFFGDSDA